MTSRIMLVSRRIGIQPLSALSQSFITTVIHSWHGRKEAAGLRGHDGKVLGLNPAETNSGTEWQGYSMGLSGEISPGNAGEIQ